MNQEQQLEQMLSQMTKKQRKEWERPLTKREIAREERIQAMMDRAEESPIEQLFGGVFN
jgi:hypothetical protein